MTSSIGSGIAENTSSFQLQKFALDFNSFEDSLICKRFRKPDIAFDSFPRKHSKGGIVKGLKFQEGDDKFLAKDRVKNTSSRKKIQRGSAEDSQPCSSQESMKTNSSSQAKSYLLIKPLTICGTVIQPA
jgi:hypothetical protein